MSNRYNIRFNGRNAIRILTMCKLYIKARPFREKVGSEHTIQVIFVVIIKVIISLSWRNCNICFKRTTTLSI